MDLEKGNVDKCGSLTSNEHDLRETGSFYEFASWSFLLDL